MGLILASQALGASAGAIAFSRFVAPARRGRWMGPLAMAACGILTAFVFRPPLPIALAILTAERHFRLLPARCERFVRHCGARAVSQRRVRRGAGGHDPGPGRCHHPRGRRSTNTLAVQRHCCGRCDRRPLRCGPRGQPWQGAIIARQGRVMSVGLSRSPPRGEPEGIASGPDAGTHGGLPSGGGVMWRGLVRSSWLPRMAVSLPVAGCVEGSVRSTGCRASRSPFRWRGCGGVGQVHWLPRIAVSLPVAGCGEGSVRSTGCRASRSPFRWRGVRGCQVQVAAHRGLLQWRGGGVVRVAAHRLCSLICSVRTLTGAGELYTDTGSGCHGGSRYMSEMSDNDGCDHDSDAAR